MTPTEKKALCSHIRRKYADDGWLRNINDDVRGAAMSRLHSYLCSMVSCYGYDLDLRPTMEERKEFAENYMRGRKLTIPNT